MGCSHGKEEFDLEANNLKSGISDSKTFENYRSRDVPIKDPDKIDTEQNNDNKENKENWLYSNGGEPVKNTKYKTKIDSRVTAKYEIKALIGKGSFSDVLRVDCKVTCQPFAVKILKVRNEQEEELLNAELSVLQAFSHRYIMHLEEVIISKECTYLIMELATGGELYDRIKSRGHLDEKYSCNITQMILEALTYLHNHGITHRDLKPENLLFYHPGSDSKILVTDFGFAKMRTNSVEFKMTTWCGTPEYIAPELLRKVPYSNKVDLWALGAIVYVMLSGHLPFSADTTPKLFKHIMSCNFNFSRDIWNTISADAKDFIQKLLTPDPMERIDANAASNHKWMKAFSPLHKSNAEARQTTKRQNTRLRHHSNVNNGAATPVRRLNSKQGVSFEDDESSLMSDSTWNNYMKHKATSPLYNKRQRISSDGNIVLPFAGGGFHANVITKDAIFEDNGSTMSPSNIDSVLATEDSNSQVSSQFGAMQLYYYKNMMAAQTPSEKQQARQEYLDYMKENELKLPLQLPISMMGRDMGAGDNSAGVSRGGMILPKIGSLKERKISVHEQFENIEEESEDGLESKGGGGMGLTKLDRMYGANSGYTNSVVSGGSLKSAHVPVEISNASYIEKVGVWLNDSKEGVGNRHGGSRGKYTFDEDKYKIGGRTSSENSNLTVSDHSQASSFNRVTLIPMHGGSRSRGAGTLNWNNSGGVGNMNKAKTNSYGYSDLHSQSFISNATSTTELLSASSVVGAASSVSGAATSSNHRGNRSLNMETNMMNNVVRPGGGSFSSAASYQPLITK